MSRNVEVQLTISDIQPSQIDEIIEKTSELFNALDFNNDCTVLYACGVGELHGGIRAVKLAELLAAATFLANGQPCSISIGIVELDSPPTWEFGPEDFARLTSPALQNNT